MKIHVWGGPMDGRIIDLPAPRPIHHLVPTIEPVGWRDAPDRLELTDRKIITYYPRQVRVDRRTWWVMVPADATDEELQRLLMQHGHPPVDTQGRGLRYIDEVL